MTIKKVTILTIVLSALIIIGAGHGTMFLGLCEIPFIIFRVPENFSFSIFESYENSLGAASLFFLTGQLLLIISILLKGEASKFWTIFFGLISLWFGFYYLSHNLLNDEVSAFSFFCALPFLIFSFILTYRIMKHKKEVAHASTTVQECDANEAK